MQLTASVKNGKIRGIRMWIFFLNIHIQGNPVIDDVLRVKSNFTIIDYYSLSLQFVIK